MADGSGRHGLVSESDWLSLLREVQSYKNDQVIFRFCRHLNISEADASSILEDTVSWLWLCEYNRQFNASPVDLRIDRPIKIIDEMWHNLILHTSDYADFCGRYFGNFIHHFPATRDDYSEHGQRKQNLSREDFFDDLCRRRRPQYELVHEKLGEETFRRWYVEYPKKYSPDVIRSLRK